jgi:signal transduction histidine kinase
MPDGGRIVLQTRNVSAANGNKLHSTPCAELTVSDAGVGMDIETRYRLFEPFFTTKLPGRGNGLGLATIHSIVQQNNGTIEVESEPGKGTRIRVRLPQASESAPTRPPAVSCPAGVKRRRTTGNEAPGETPRAARNRRERGKQS